MQLQKTNHVLEKTRLLGRIPSGVQQVIPNLSQWTWEELDALSLMLGHQPIDILLNNFRCNPEELRSAIACQLTCAAWSSGTDGVQHFATTMLVGKTPDSQYTNWAIELLSADAEVVKLNPEHYENDDVQKLENAIAFLKRFN